MTSTTASCTSTPFLTTGSITTDVNPYDVFTINSSGNYNYNYNNGSYTTYWQNPLKDLIYSAIFEIDKNDMLSSNLIGIKKNKFTFSCDYVGNRIQPYEFIMNLIKEKMKFSVSIKISNILTICYTDLQFTKIENNFDFSKTCDLSELKVKFKYDDIKFENHKLSKKELRADKLKNLNL